MKKVKCSSGTVYIRLKNISEDENSATMEDGTELVFSPTEGIGSCLDCDVYKKLPKEIAVSCVKTLCSLTDRKDEKDGIWRIK